jgi:anaerobic ribonucleoside-triphosphate reductase activating protein
MRVIKYHSIATVFSEVPDEFSLVISIVGCPGTCKGCHSPFLRRYDGIDLDLTELTRLLNIYAPYVTTICFLGGDWEPSLINALKFIKDSYELKICLYSGKNFISYDILKYLDYVKLGPYDYTLGDLKMKNTNQKFYSVKNGNLNKDLTYKFKRFN